MRVITFEDRFSDDVFVFSETKVELVGVLFCLVRARERRKNISVKNTFEIINGKKRSKNTIETHPRPAALVHFYRPKEHTTTNIRSAPPRVSFQSHPKGRMRQQNLDVAVLFRAVRWNANKNFHVCRALLPPNEIFPRIESEVFLLI